jgi:hypothetical protein
MSRSPGAHARAAHRQSTAPGIRLGRAEARRLLAGRAPRDQRNLALQYLLAAAATPDPEQSDRGLGAVLAAFAQSAAATPDPASRRAGQRAQWDLPRWSRALVVKCMAALILVSSAGAAAAADALPAPVQSFVYDMFGDLGVPAPPVSPSRHPDPSSHPSAGPTASATPGPGQSSSAAPQNGSALTSAPGGPTQTPDSPTALCQAAVHSLTTPGSLAPAELAQLGADAGGYQHIAVYCAEVLRNTDSGGFPPSFRSSAPTLRPTITPPAPYRTTGAKPTATTKTPHTVQPHATTKK